MMHQGQAHTTHKAQLAMLDACSPPPRRMARAAAADIRGAIVRLWQDIWLDCYMGETTAVAAAVALAWRAICQLQAHGHRALCTTAGMTALMRHMTSLAAVTATAASAERVGQLQRETTSDEAHIAEL
jgi:hypothetical protein